MSRRCEATLFAVAATNDNAVGLAAHAKADSEFSGQ